MLPWITLIIVIVFFIIKRSELMAFLAKRRYAKGDLQGALRKFALAKKIGKLSAASLFYYGYLLLRDGQVDYANTILTHASFGAKKPALKKRIKSMLAICEWKNGNLDNAIEMTEEVMVDYKTTNLYQNLGLLYVLRGDAKKAVEFNKEAYDYNSDDMIIMDNLAEAYALDGDVENATEMYEKLLEKEPHFPEPYYGFGLLLVENGQKERGIKLIEESLEKRFTFLSVLQKDEVEKLLEEARNK